MCIDCFQTQKQIQEGVAIVQSAAKKYAVENNVNVFIFQTPEGWQYMAEEPARKIGIIPQSVVSGLVPAS